VPALGPAYAEKTLFYSLPDTGVAQLQNTLFDHRAEVMFDPHASSTVQSIAAFASLHIAVVFAAALIAQLAGAPRLLWHYVVDDVAGLAIGGIAVYAGARLTGVELSPLRRRLPAVLRGARLRGRSGWAQ
jgi:hypothetical protein